MTTCLLCPSQAVADGLCVADGARLWAAKLWESDPLLALAGALDRRPWQNEERRRALRELDTQEEATVFLARLDAARAERKRAEDERIRRRDGVM